MNNPNSRHSTEPLITVAVTAYNVAPLLKRCMDSIVSQSYQNLEIIILDDGSEDHFREVIQPYTADPRVRILTQKNAGISKSRNRCLSEANGEWFSFVDGDDALLPDAIQILYDAAVEADVSLVTGSYEMISGNGKHVTVILNERFRMSGEEPQRYFLKDGASARFPWGKLYHRSLYRNMHYEDNAIYEDLRILPVLSENSGSCRVISALVYSYYLRKDSVTYTTDIARQMDGLAAVLDYEAFINEHYPALHTEASENTMTFCLYLLGRICRAGRRNNLPYWEETLRMFRDRCASCTPKSRMLKAAAAAVRIAPVCTGYLCHWYSRLKNGV